MRTLAPGAAVLGTLLVLAAPAGAALQKYRLETVDISSTPWTSPNVLVENSRPGFLESDEGPPLPPFDSALIETGGASGPVLRRFRMKTAFSGTLHSYPAIIFTSDAELEGPGPLRQPAAFTGSGSTAAGSTIRWGTVTGWTITGSLYTRCFFMSFPGGRSPSPLLCSWIGREHDTTVDPVLHSEFYDLGTWFFHATGFTATPFLYEYLVDGEGQDAGNRQRWVRGFPVTDATVPALPAIGSALLAGSLLLALLAALRHRVR